MPLTAIGFFIVKKDFIQNDENNLFQEMEINKFIERSSLHIQKNYTYEESHLQSWKLFCKHINELPEINNEKLNKSEKLILLRTTFRCLKNPLEQGKLAQLMRAAEELKYALGTCVFQDIFEAEVSPEKRVLHNYITVCQLLVELKNVSGIQKIIDTTLPNLDLLVDKLRDRHIQYMLEKYPERNIDETLTRFGKRDDIVQFPLSQTELNKVKIEYLEVKKNFEAIRLISSSELKSKVIECSKIWREKNDHNAKFQLIACIVETIRRIYKIVPYDTQILSLLALINVPEKLKGRIAQIQTGEGKSTIDAMLAGFMGCSGEFVDVFTSSPYLAKRDAQKYKPFFEALDLTVSAIHDHSLKKDFYGQVLYGTNTAFEFALEREGLYQDELRYSMKLGKIQHRTFDTAIPDEVDNILIDKARNSAILALPNNEGITWIYKTILDFVNNIFKNTKIDKNSYLKLREFLLQHFETKYYEIISSFSEYRLTKWLESAQNALFKYKEKIDYLVRCPEVSNQNNDDDVEEIVIVDAKDTGCRNEGSEWQHGLHQFLQAKHNLKITPETLSASSLAHPTYFSLYKHLFGLTGTMGEKVERDEVQAIYHVDCFDVPTHFPSLRKKLPTVITKTKKEKYPEILKRSVEMQKQGRPVLILCSTIKESEVLSDFLKTSGVRHQVLNDAQTEEESYLVSRAGESGVVTDATNIAGRGTDIILSVDSKKAGGLYQLSTFYYYNLRVERQGSGRAGRQGDPGSCCMVLSEEDEEIQVMFKICNQLGIPIDTNKMLVEDILAVLDRVRTIRTEKESALRLQRSQLENLFFEKLQTFFKDMKMLYQVFEDTSFKEKVISSCQNFKPDINKGNSFVLKSDDFTLLKETASRLCEKQNEGSNIDWTGFYSQFKQIYLDAARHQWALFYNRLHNEIEGIDLKSAQTQMEKFYNEAKPELDHYFSNPAENALQFLGNLLQSASTSPSGVPRMVL